MTYRILGINFDHMHMGDLLRQVHGTTPRPKSRASAMPIPPGWPRRLPPFAIPPDRVFTDVACAMAQRPIW